jgi:hypothetical protein
MLVSRRSAVAGGAIAAVLGGSLLFTAGPAVASAAHSTTHPRVCKPLPVAVTGVNDAFKAGAPSGIYVWHNDGHWSLRATHPGDGLQIFAGKVHSNRVLHFDRFKLEKNDITYYSDAHHTLNFRFHNVGYVDGLNFVDSCSINTTFAFHQADKSKLPATQIFLGSAGVNPTSDPFTIQR